MSEVIKKIKNLNSKIKDISDECDLLKIEIAKNQRKLSDKNKEIKLINAELKQIGTFNDIHISEHAIIRYLERVEKINIESVRDKIITEDLKLMVNTIGGTGLYPIDNFKVRMKNNIIITITT